MRLSIQRLRQAGHRQVVAPDSPVAAGIWSKGSFGNAVHQHGASPG